MNLANHPRVPLAFLPTPLEALPRLSAALNGPTLWVKRDDMTGLALGGNKARKLEYLLGDAQAQGATVVMTTAGAASNYLRMTAAGARKAGMRPILFMRGTGQEPIQGNLLLNQIVGAEMRFIAVTDPWSPEARQIMDAAAAELTAQGERVYVMAIQNTHAPLAALGYVNAALELYQQLLHVGAQATHIFAPTGSGVTQAGLILGAKLLHWPLQVVGMAGAPNTADGHRRRIAEMVRAAGKLLDVDVAITPDEVIVEDRFAGESYGAATAGVVQAIRLCGEQEGLILDPVYSGKAMHGLLTWIAEGRLRAADQVVFLHTGGAPNLFTQAESLGASLMQQHVLRESSIYPTVQATAMIRGVTVTKGKIEHAIKDFDKLFSSDSNAYDSWLDKNTYKWALCYKGSLYPHKYILSLATGLQTTDFVASEARRVLGNLGFQIIPKP